MSDRIKCWEYNKTSVQESLQELSCEHTYNKKKDKIDWTERPKCEHFWNLYHAKWEAFFFENPEVWRPGF